MAEPVDLNGKTVIVSRTDSIGDVMLTLPICAWMKKKFPSVKLLFLGKGYTKAIVESYAMVDQFLDWNDFLSVPKTEKIQLFRSLEADVIIHVFPDKEIAALAKKARVPVRVGTSHRAYHLVTCSHRINFTRKKSDLHEAQLNHELLRPFGLSSLPDLETIIGETIHFKVPDVNLLQGLNDLENSVILHPKSQGSAKEWPMENYLELAKRLVEKGKTVIFTGTEKEGEQFRDILPSDHSIIDTTGKLSLEQLMMLISKAENLVACSTGPLHIAGYYGVGAIGLFSPRRPIHPGRWRALGANVSILVFDENCQSCNQIKDCDCISKISVERVLEKIA